jgi:hypothetical protein
MAKKKQNVWKILSIVFIVLFLLVIISGLWRAYHFRHSVVKATLAQTDIVKSVAMTDLNNRGINVSSLSFKVSEEIRKTPMNPNNTQILEVSAHNASVRYMYIIDVQSANILVYSMTEFYDGLNHSEDRAINSHDMREPREPFRN